MICVQSPGRAGIIGNPSDGYGGAVVSCAIKNQAKVMMQASDELVITNRFGSRVLKQEEDFENQGDYFDLPRVVLRYFKLLDLKANITITTTIPEQAGLAGSTAILAALINAVSIITEKTFDQFYLAELTRYLEYCYLGVQCGYQDAYMTVFGGIKYIDCHGKEYYRKLEKEPYANVESLGNCADALPFVVVYSGLKHHSGQFHLPLRERWIEGDNQVVKAYREIGILAEEGRRALLAKDWHLMASLMKENHRLQNSLSYSGEQNNYLIEVAEQNGALAAKLAGAGEGGSIIALTLNTEATLRALQKAGAVEYIELDPRGTGITVSGATLC